MTKFESPLIPDGVSGLSWGRVPARRFRCWVRFTGTAGLGIVGNGE